MKTIKYIFASLAMIVCLLMNGELFQNYFTHFYAPIPNMLVAVQENADVAEITKDIQAAAQKNDVTVFLMDIKEGWESAATIRFYTNNSKKLAVELREQYQVEEKLYDSLFWTTTQVEILPLDQLPFINAHLKIHMIGEAENLPQFQKTLEENYATDDISWGVTVSQEKNQLFGYWVIVIALVLLFSLYEVLLKKKEWFVQISLGERAVAILGKNIAADSLAFSVSFALILFALQQVTNAVFLWQISLTMFGVLLLVNALPYLAIFRPRWQEVFSNTSSSVGLLTASYAVKMLTTVLTILLVSSNFVVIQEALLCYRQKPFFEKYENYNYVSFTFLPSEAATEKETFERSLRADNQSARLNYKLYKTQFHSGDATMQVLLGNWKYKKEEGSPVISLNQNAGDYLKQQLKMKDSKKLLENKVYYLFPANLYTQAQVENQLEAFHSLYGDDPFHFGYDFEYEALLYEGDLELLGLTGSSFDMESNYVQNPIIIYSNLDESLLQIKNEELQIINISAENGSMNANFTGLLTTIPEIMYCITEEEALEFAKEAGLNPNKDIVSVQNVYEVYEESWSVAKKLLIFNCIISALLIVLELIVLAVIIQLEYRVNAMELAVRKIFGHSIFRRHNQIFALTIVVSLVGIIISCIAGNMLEYDLRVSAAGGLILLSFELLASARMIYKTERMSIQRILKEGY